MVNIDVDVNMSIRMYARTHVLYNMFHAGLVIYFFYGMWNSNNRDKKFKPVEDGSNEVESKNNNFTRVT